MRSEISLTKFPRPPYEGDPRAYNLCTLRQARCQGFLLPGFPHSPVAAAAFRGQRGRCPRAAGLRGHSAGADATAGAAPRPERRRLPRYLPCAGLRGGERPVQGKFRSGLNGPKRRRARFLLGDVKFFPDQDKMVLVEMVDAGHHAKCAVACQECFQKVLLVPEKDVF